MENEDLAHLYHSSYYHLPALSFPSIFDNDNNNMY